VPQPLPEVQQEEAPNLLAETVERQQQQMEQLQEQLRAMMTLVSGTLPILLPHHLRVFRTGFCTRLICTF
jgi:hypothetical protein